MEKCKEWAMLLLFITSLLIAWFIGTKAKQRAEVTPTTGDVEILNKQEHPPANALSEFQVFLMALCEVESENNQIGRAHV